ncbi:hypothetical protein ACFXAZ_37000 [Streptomyces sp. NPDC059477]|uniref:hypothetical protein n=1 Tax=Streptomyces sp. NPDC059477 TaxID=3346847 RepID=UPI003696E8D1
MKRTQRMSEWPADESLLTDAYTAEATRKIAALWESIGFRHFRNCDRQFRGGSVYLAGDVVGQEVGDGCTDRPAADPVVAGEGSLPPVRHPQTSDQDPCAAWLAHARQVRGMLWV